MNQENRDNLIKLLITIENSIHNNSRLSKYEKYIKRIRKNIEIPLQVMLMGEFSTGKSTVINALVGKEVTTVAATEETGLITKLVYGNIERICIYYKDGTSKICSRNEYRSISSTLKEECINNKAIISYIEYALPIDFLKNINLIDSPGINSNNIENARITEDFVYNSDAVLWLATVNSYAGAYELKALDRLSSRLKNIVVINKMDDIDEEEESPEEILEDATNRYGKRVSKVIGISAKMAYDGRVLNNSVLYDESNIRELENYIEDELVSNSNRYKFNSFLDGLSEIEMYMENENIDIYFMRDVIEYVKKCCHGNVSDRSPSENCFIGINEADDRESFRIVGLAAEGGNILSQIIIMAYNISRNKISKDSLVWWDNINENDIENIEIPYIRQLCYEIIGTRYCMGIDDDKDLSKAIYHYEKAREMGSLFATTQMGVIYSSDAYNDYEKGVKFFKEAADKEYALAQYFLGNAYYNGCGVDRDIVSSLEWYEKSAKNGEFSSMEILSLAYGIDDMSEYYEESKSKYWLNELHKKREEEANKKLACDIVRKDVQKWLCTCGEENVGFFCGRCGKARRVKTEKNKKNVWSCRCGANNKGFFCVKCGRGKS